MKDSEPPCSLEDVLRTAELDHRPCRPAHPEKEHPVLLRLIRELAREPQEFFPKLVQAVMDLSSADSAGVSVLDRRQGRFIWPAVAGGLGAYVGAGTPENFGPCGTVLELNASVLFARPEKYFTYLDGIAPPLEEVLLAPFHIDDVPVGTLWAITHQRDRQFDAEDRRLLESLSEFAASAYRVLSSTGQLTTLLDELPRPQSGKRQLVQEEGKWRFEGV